MRQEHQVHREQEDNGPPPRQEQHEEDNPPRQEQHEIVNPHRHGRHHPRPQHNEEQRYGKLKFTMPKFTGSNDPEEYISWALKVDKIFRLHNYEEEKKIAMASLEFQDYVLIWWEQVIERRAARGEPPITTWAQMKDVMRARFVPNYYNRDLFKKLQQLKQGTKSVEEYYKEMEIAMIRANVKEDDEQTMARFLNGLNHPIKKIADFQPYSNLIELVHQATKAERQVQDDFKYAKFSSKSYGLSNNQASTTSTPSTKPSTSNGDKSSYKKASTSSSRPPTTSNFKPKASSSSTPTDETIKTSSIKCFTCGGRGHKSFECTNKRTMILNDDGTYDSMSEGEMEALEQVAMHRQVNNEEEDDHIFCDEDSSPALVVSKVLTLQHQQDEDQRCHIFHTKAGINGRSVKVIIDGGSCHNLASEELCSKLQLVKMKHPHPYKVQWLSDTGTIQVEQRVQVSFKIGAYEDTLECDVLPMTVCHLLLGRPWQFDRGVIHNGRTNHYSFKMKGKEFVLRPMSPSQVLADKQNTHRGENSERVNHQKESERHKPKLSASTMSDKKNLVLFATKREMREVCENPSSVLHYVLLCKDEAPKTNTSHDLPLVLSSLLQEFEDVSPDELPPGLPPLRGI